MRAPRRAAAGRSARSAASSAAGPGAAGLPRRVVFAEDAVGRFGGVETLLRALAPALQDRGIRVEFLSHHRPSGPAPAPGRTVWFAPRADESRWASALRRIRRRLWFARLGGEDAVVMMNETVAADLLPDLAARRRARRPAPFTAMEFHSRFESAWRQAGDATLRQAAAECDAFLALDRHEAQRFADHFGCPVGAVPNPLPVPVAEQPRTHRPEELVCVARLAPEKRVDWVLRAFDALAEDFPGWRLSVVGDGPERPALEQLREALPSGGRIRFLGEHDPAQLVEDYDAAGLLALASRFEGTPMVLAEAGARGVPVVCTPSSDGVRAVCERAGYLSEEDFGSFAAALRRAVSDSEQNWRELSAAGLERARGARPEQVIEHWLDLLRTRDPRSVPHAEPRET